MQCDVVFSMDLEKFSFDIYCVSSNRRCKELGKDEDIQFQYNWTTGLVENILKWSRSGTC